jgi:predicted GTPase
LLAATERLVAVTAGLLADGARRDLLEARTRVREDRFNLVMLGEFKRGKSTLINALLDRDLVPTGVVPLTSVVTVIGAGPPDRLVVRYADGPELERPVEELGEYVTEAGNPGNRLGVELARVELDHELLRGGLELVDTPGIGSVHSQNTEVARDFLPRVDAALCVLDAGQPLSEAERQLFVDAARRVPRLLIVINKIDHLDEADREVAVEFVRSALRDLLEPNGAELYAVSARRGDGVTLLRTPLLRWSQTNAIRCYCGQWLV